MITSGAMEVMGGDTNDPGTNAHRTPHAERNSTGALCLDFLASMKGAPITGTDGAGRLSSLLQRLELPLPQGGLVPEDVERATELADAVGHAVHATILGEAATPDAVRRINSLAALPTPIYLLEPSTLTRAPIPQVDLLPTLSVVARDTIHLLSRREVGRLRLCAREQCSTAFLDRSPTGRRRWCSMKGCGESAAASRYRRRKAPSRNDGDS